MKGEHMTRYKLIYRKTLAGLRQSLEEAQRDGYKPLFPVTIEPDQPDAVLMECKSKPRKYSVEWILRHLAGNG